MQSLEIKKEFLGNDKVKISLEFIFKNNEFVTDTIPYTCGNCPVGFLSQEGCGKRLPIDITKRSPNCKLQTIEQYLSKYVRR